MTFVLGSCGSHVIRSAIVAALPLLLAATTAAHATDRDHELARETAGTADTAQAYPEKRSSRSGWERVVNAPGRLAYVPIDLFFEGTKSSISFVTDRQLLARTVDFLTADDGSWGVYPVFTPRGGGGLKYFRRGLFSENSKLTLAARIGLNRRQKYEFELKRVSLFGGKITGGFNATYRLETDESFFGLGPDSDFDDERNFSHEKTSLELNLGRIWGQTVYVGSQLGVDVNNILKGRGTNSPPLSDDPNAAALPGFDDQVRMGRVAMDVEIDNRDFPGSPTRGWLARAGAGYYAEIDDDSYGFWKFAGDIATTLHVAYRRVFDIRLAGEATETLGDRLAPFYYLSEMGNYETARGFSKGRYRDRNAVYGTVQYRWPVRRGTDAILFVDAGEVFDDLDRFKRKRVQVGWGGGFRFFSSRDVVARLEIGKSRDEYRLYFVLN